MNTQMHSQLSTPTSESGELATEEVVARRSTSDRSLLRIAAVAIPVGLVLQIAMETLHPSKADPNDSVAAFQEYAASTTWTIVHIGQFFAALLVALALVALARSLSREGGVPGALAVIGGATAILVAAIFAVQMAVDGVVLKATIDTWNNATQAADKSSAYQVAEATRSLEKALSGFFHLVNGTTLLILGLAIALRTRLPPLARLGRRGVGTGLPHRRCGYCAHRLLTPGGQCPPRTGRPRHGLPARCSGVHVAQEQHRSIAGDVPGHATNTLSRPPHGTGPPPPESTGSTVPLAHHHPQHLHGGTVNTRVRTNDGPASTRFDDYRPVSSSSGSRWWHHPGLVRVGGVDGMLSPLPLLAAGLITATAGQNLRQNGFPWAATLAAILTAICVLGLTALHSPRWTAPVRATGLVTAAALLGIAGFFTALGIEDLLATLAGTPRFLSDNQAITGIGTLTGSLLTLVLTPLGLAVIGIATYRAGLLSRTGRLAAMALAAVPGPRCARLRGRDLGSGRRGLGAGPRRLLVPARPRPAAQPQVITPLGKDLPMSHHTSQAIDRPGDRDLAAPPLAALHQALPADARRDVPRHAHAVPGVQPPGRPGGP